MGYQKIVQYGDVTEIYTYEKNLNRKQKGISPLTALRIQKGVRNNEKKRNYKKSPTKSELFRIQQKAKKYSRSRRSIARSRQNFFRLCHNNNCLAKTIHFLTLTFAYDVEYKKANQVIRDFFKRVKQNYESPISYICTPEKTKKGRYHFHLLVYNLPPEEEQNERATRYLQRQFNHGYLDLRYAPNTTEKIAGYMAKYMGKALTNAKNQGERGYTCSRNIDKVRFFASNSLSSYDEMLIPNEPPSETREYDVPYLGRCLKTIIKSK